MLKNIKLRNAYINHNKKIFAKRHNLSVNKILIELNYLCESHIVYSYLANILAEKHNAEITSYRPNFFQKNLRSLLSRFIKKIVNHENSIYSSFGTKKNIIPKKKYCKKIEKIFYNQLKKINSKSDILKVRCENINIGDLIYDGFLRKYDVPTIEINSNLFESYFKDFLYLFYFWFHYFKKNKVKAVIVSHAAYEFAIPLRIAINKKIDAFTASTFGIYRHSQKNQNVFDMKYYEQYFSKKKNKKELLRKAKKLIDLKFSGYRTIENKCSQFPKDNLFKNIKYKNKILTQNNKKNILIAAHHFSDNPNVYGRFLFSDYYEWIDFLGKKSNNSKYNWYIKFHPLEFDFNKKIAEYFLEKYRNIKLIPNNIKHSQLISEGIDLVLTVNGTIGFEYAYFGKHVINAGLNNPHIAYNFNYHSKSISNYEYAIDNFSKLKLNFKKEQFYKYFYMRYLDSFYLFSDELDNNEDISFYQTPQVYQKWLNSYNKTIEKKIREHITNFILSRNYRCSRMY